MKNYIPLKTWNSKQKSKSKLQKVSQQSLITRQQVRGQFISIPLMNFHKRRVWQPLDKSMTRVKLSNVPDWSCLLATADASVGQGESAAFLPPLCFGRIIKGRPVVISQPLTVFVPVCNAVRKKKKHHNLVCDKASFFPRHMGAAGECHTLHGVTWNTVKLKLNNRRKKTKTSHLIMPLGEKKKKN